MSLSTTTSKQILLLLNFIFTVLGLILIGFGIYILVSSSENKVDHGENLAGGLVIALGVILVVVAIFGCLAAIHESRNKLIVYIVSVGILILLQLTLYSMTSLGTKDGLSASVKEGFESLWEYEHENPDVLAYYQNWLHCCGVNNTDDYHRINHDLPKSCCKHQNCRIVDNIYMDGCEAKFIEYLSGKMLIFAILSWILIIAEIIACIFGWLMISGLKNQQRRNTSWM